MKQVIRKGIGEIIIDDVPDPIAPAHHVLIKPVFSLISPGTETASIHQEGILKEVKDNPGHIRKVWNVVKVQPPSRTAAETLAKLRQDYAVIGYSGAGVVVEKHPSVTDLEIGQRVAYGGEGTGHGETIVTGRQLVAQVPDSVRLEDAAFGTLASIALNAVRTAQISLGDTVAVIGLGLVGQLVAQLARLQGAVVMAVDLREDRVALARTLGAPFAFSGSSATDGVKGATNGRGADCVIIAAAAKSKAPCELALAMCRDRGRIVVVGAVDLSFPWNDMYLKDIQMYMSRAYGPGSYDSSYEKQGRDYPIGYVRWTENRNMEEVLRLMGTGALKVADLVTDQFALDDAPAAYEKIMQPGSSTMAVLLRYDTAEQEPAQVAASFAPRRKVQASRSRAKGDKLGVALVGAAGLARWEHLPNLKKVAGAELRAVHSTSGARGKGFAERWGAAYCATDLTQILEDESIDVVLITSKNQHHASQTLESLRAGKHVFVEKPMALTEQECRDVEEAVSSSGKVLTVGFNRRFAPFYVGLKKALRSAGGPAVINIRVNSPGISGAFWMADPAIGGAILGEACHFIDLMYWLLDAEPIAVSAYSLPTGTKDPIGENNMTAAFTFADGSIASLAYSTVGSRTSGGERVEVFAPGIGAMTENFKRFEVWGGMVRSSRKIWADKGYDVQLNDFFDAIAHDRAPGVTVADGSRATIGCLRMMESARDRRPRSLTP